MRIQLIVGGNGTSVLGEVWTVSKRRDRLPASDAALRETLGALSPPRLFPGRNVTFQVRQRFLRSGLNGPAAPLNFSHQHRALDRSDAKISHPLGVRLFGSIFFEKESRNLALHHFKYQA